MPVTLYEANCLDILKSLPKDTIDSVVTDPPYHLTQLSRGGSPRVNDIATPFGRTRLGDRGFMGLNWDGGDIAFRVETWVEILRVLKPGGHLLSFSGTRTYHRMAVAIEDAGFEIRDQIGWLYGSGFPKSHNLDGDWEGWGTALKPAWEPLVLARKPLIGTVAANVQAFGTGAMNITECRVGTELRTYDLKGGENLNKIVRADGNDADDARSLGAYGIGAKQVSIGTATVAGRWPANVIHDGSDEVEEAFAQYGNRGASAPVRGHEPSRTGQNGIYSHWDRVPGTFFDDTGTASRFFYCAKASKSERDGSKHPTVKPLSLMRYLCKLVTPPGGTVLDPFAGTGTTGQAAVEEGFNAVLIEREASYCKDIRHRLALYIEGEDGHPPLIQFTVAAPG